jgi:subtilisin family serine protease
MADRVQFIPDLKDKILKTVSVLSEQQNWGLSFIDAQEAWKHSKGANVKVAIIDTGWTEHKDLMPNFIEGHDATGNNDYIDRGNFHGTHVAGIIGANCGQGVGVMGVAPEAKMIAIKALSDDGSGSFDFIERALEIARDSDVDVINMSLGSPVDPGNPKMHNLITEIANQGKIVVCASGNDGASVNFPAKYDEVIAVAAVEASGQLARFSSRGPELDIAAPGVKIYSTWGNNQYISLDGTSMACPCISGMIALILSWYKLNPSPNFVKDYKNMIKLLYELGESSIIQTNEYNIGVPKFANFDPWKPVNG